MSYQFECRNVVPGCDGVVQGETQDDVLSAAAAHASEVHGLDPLPDEVVEKVKTSIHAAG